MPLNLSKYRPGGIRPNWDFKEQRKLSFSPTAHQDCALRVSQQYEVKQLTDLRLSINSNAPQFVTIKEL
jgi:hypothetical protein